MPDSLVPLPALQATRLPNRTSAAGVIGCDRRRPNFTGDLAWAGGDWDGRRCRAWTGLGWGKGERGGVAKRMAPSFAEETTARGLAWERVSWGKRQVFGGREMGW